MDYQYFSTLCSQGVDFGIDPSIPIKSINNECSASGWLAMPIIFSTPRLAREQMHEILFSDRPRDRKICYLLTCKGEDYSFSAASAIYATAFLKDLEAVDLATIANGTYKFKSDYLVIAPAIKERYTRKYKESSLVWGGFYHNDNNIPPNISSSNRIIKAYPDIKLPTPLHYSEAFRANRDGSAIGRFLALYHLIELSFDHDLVEEIKALPDNLKMVGKLLATFDHGELARLTRLIKKYWSDEASLSTALAIFFQPSTFDNQVRELLFEYGKDGFPWWNPKHEKEKLQVFLTTASATFNKDKFKEKKLEWSLENLQKAVAFIIYRFRCSIAHASIGEYVISSEDDDFVEQLAEPLVITAITKIFHRPS